MKSTCMIFAPDGRIWQSDDVPPGKEKEVGLRLLNMTIEPGRDSIRVPWFEDISVSSFGKGMTTVPIQAVTFRFEGTYRGPGTEKPKAYVPPRNPARDAADALAYAMRTIYQKPDEEEVDEPEAPDGINDYDCTIK